jgi:hypothetical protein
MHHIGLVFFPFISVIMSSFCQRAALFYDRETITQYNDKFSSKIFLLIDPSLITIV